MLRLLSSLILCLFVFVGACTAQEGAPQPALARDASLNPMGELTDLEVVTAEGAVHKFQVEVRDDPSGRAMGMMHRTATDPDKGMIFLFDRPARQGFWMKNTLIPLDIIFIRSTGRIANIRANVPPQTLDSRTSQGPAIAVLELAGGRAAELGIKKGDLVRHAGLNNLRSYGASGGAER